MRFLRYPGGKGRLLVFLDSLLPKNHELGGKYIEPFLGGGSVFLYVQPEQAIVSDLNKELIDLYKGIRNYPHKVWDAFRSFPIGREAYYKIRDEEKQSQPLFYRAARTLYLNRTCFKGMWRHGLGGKFNVGYGGEERRWVITHETIIELSRRFRKATIVHSDFEPILDLCADGDFIFLDPPYKPGERDMIQAHYINGRFSFEDQVRLSKKLKEVTDKCRIRWLMTNSSNREICKLYDDFNIVSVPVGVSDLPGLITNTSNEVVISNCKVAGIGHHERVLR